MGSLERRYAEALLSLTDNAAQADRVGAALNALGRLFKESDELRGFVLNPVISGDVRGETLLDILEMLGYMKDADGGRSGVYLYFRNENSTMGADGGGSGGAENVADDAAGGGGDRAEYASGGCGDGSDRPEYAGDDDGGGGDRAEYAGGGCNDEAENAADSGVSENDAFDNVSDGCADEGDEYMEDDEEEYDEYESDDEETAGAAPDRTEHAGVLLSRFLRLLLGKGRLAFLPDIAEEYEMIKAGRRNALLVTVRSSAPLDAASLEKIRDKYKNQYGASYAEVDNIVEPSLIGGVCVQIGDVRIDDTIYGRLAALARIIAAGAVMQPAEAG